METNYDLSPYPPFVSTPRYYIFCSSSPFSSGFEKEVKTVETNSHFEKKKRTTHYQQLKQREWKQWRQKTNISKRARVREEGETAQLQQQLNEIGTCYFFFPA